MAKQELDATKPLARGLDGTDLTPLIKALAMLGSDLDLAFNGNPERLSSEDERSRYIYAFRALSIFLQACGGVHARRFWRLVMAFDDLNYGVTDPLLKVRRTGGSKGNTWLWCARANVALGMYVLVEASLSRKEAAERAAKIILELIRWPPSNEGKRAIPRPKFSVGTTNSRRTGTQQKLIRSRFLFLKMA
jgi:hypothetical protein